MKTRTLIFRLHLIAGLTAGLLLVLTGLTGSLLVFDDTIDRALNSHLLRVAPRGERITAGGAVEAVRQAYPRETVQRVRWPRDAEGSFEVCLSAKGDPRCVYIDPYSARILGERVPAESFKARVLALHRRLLSGETGELIVGVGGLFLVALGLSGIYLWWPGRGQLRRRGFKINWQARGRKFNFDLHRIVGVCAMAFLTLNGLTGAMMAFNKTSERVVSQLTGNSPRPQPPVSKPQGAGGTRAAPLDAVLRNADAALPDSETVLVNLPNTPAAPYVVRKRLPGEWHPNGRSAVYLDQYDSSVLQVENALVAHRGTRIMNALYPVHTGRPGGLPTRILLAATGLTPLLLFTSGLLMWRQRRRAPARSRRSMNVAPELAAG